MFYVIMNKKETIDFYLSKIQNLNFRFNDYYGISYLTDKEYFKAKKIFLLMSNKKYISDKEHHILVNVYSNYYSNHSKIRELINKEPRQNAQRFIGKKKIRQYIFNRDNHTCLSCGLKENLSIDHIQSIKYGGENKISNLQTLCSSCNSKKGINFFDYR